MAYNFQKYNLDRIQYLGAGYDTGEHDAFIQFQFQVMIDCITVEQVR